LDLVSFFLPLLLDPPFFVAAFLPNSNKTFLLMFFTVDLSFASKATFFSSAVGAFQVLLFNHDVIFLLRCDNEFVRGDFLALFVIVLLARQSGSEHLIAHCPIIPFEKVNE
jgi:hypothetical protein